jgi:transposase-like protein
MSGKKGMKAYPVELKLEAMRLYYEEGKTRAEITVLLGIGNAYALKPWGKLYRREGVSALKKTKGRPRKSENEKAELERLRMDAKRDLLKKFHANCAKRRSRNAISGHRSSPRRRPSESDV